MESEKLLVLIINDMVIFPNNEIRVEYDNTFDKSMINIIDKLDNDLMLIVNPIEEGEELELTNLPNYGTLGRLKLKMNVPNGKTRVVIEGLKRVEISNYSTKEEQYFYANYKEIFIASSQNEKDYSNILVKSLEQYIDRVPYMSNAVITQLSKVNNLDELCDLIGSFLTIEYQKKKKYITIIDPVERCQQIIEDINQDLKFIELEQSIEDKVEKELSDTQKEYFLREKIKIMQQELGEVNSKDDEIVKLKNKCSKLKCSLKVKERIKREISRYESINSNSPELGIVREYLDWMLNLPWNNITKDNDDLVRVKNILDSSHYALEDVKERIIEYLAVKQNTNSLRSPILCLVGPPGVGKTSLALSIAKSLGRKTAKISVGGINDEAEIIGHRRTYVGANPGRIIQGIRKAGTTNPVFIIDEIDKMTKDIKGDPASCLLEVLDPEQNNKFSDHYIEEDFDLSKVLFIATANYIEQIPYELRDRLEIINVSSYTEYEKLDISKRHLVPKQLEEHGLTPLQVQITDEALMIIIRNYTKEAGVRELDRMIATLFRKIVKKILLEKDITFYTIDTNVIEEFLGKKKYQYTETSDENEIGVVNGMAYTVFGGDILPIEATLYKGKGNLTLTGSLGDVMQESCHIALSYIKANMKEFSLGEKIFMENDIHIHVPEGAVNKDGPSAGITITTALISLLTNKNVDNSIAMTGEITLRGRVLGIGGLKEKIIGAHRAGIKKIILPQENEKDLEEVPNEVKASIEFKFVKKYDEIFKMLFKVGKKMTYDLEDKINMLYLKNQLVNADVFELKKYYSDDASYEYYLDTLNILLDYEPMFFLIDSSILSKAEEVFYEKRFDYKSPELIAIINEIIGRINELNSLSESTKKLSLTQYVMYQQQSRETFFRKTDDLLRTLAYDAEVIDKIYKGYVGDVNPLYFFLSTNYLTKTIPEFYEEDTRRIDLTMFQLDKHAKKRWIWNYLERAFAKDVIKNVQKIKIKEE